MHVWRNGWYNDSLDHRRSAFVPCVVSYGVKVFLFAPYHMGGVWAMIIASDISDLSDIRHYQKSAGTTPPVDLCGHDKMSALR